MGQRQNGIARVLQGVSPGSAGGPQHVTGALVIEPARHHEQVVRHAVDVAQRHPIELAEPAVDAPGGGLDLPPELEGYRIVQWSDVHVGPTIQRRFVQSLVERTNAVDADAIAIRYRDGTLHVVAPTSDGLVALFVSSRPGAGPLSKVQEAERALGALHRLAREGAKGRAG